MSALFAECINEELDLKSCYCLNESKPNQHQHLFVGDSTLGLKSDADGQLIMHLAFKQTCKLTSLVLGVPGDGSCPSTVKLFANVNHLGFQEASSRAPTQKILIAPSDSVVNISLQASKWQHVESLTLFVEDNHGSPFTFLQSLNVWGAIVHTTDVNKIWNSRRRV